MKKIVMSLCFLLSVGSYQFSYAVNQLPRQSKEKTVVISYVTDIINNTESPIIVTSPFIKNGDVFITKNVSLIDHVSSIPVRSSEYKDEFTIAPKTKSSFSNLKMPYVSASTKTQPNYRIRSNNYNPGTIHAICIDLPPQKYQLNYSIVHKPLPVIAVRQKGNLFDMLLGDGLNSIRLNNKEILSPSNESLMPFTEKIKSNTGYTIEINQVKPIGHFESIRHDSLDLSTMYLDGGAWVSPLRLNPHTIDIVIKRNNL